MHEEWSNYSWIAVMVYIFIFARYPGRIGLFASLPLPDLEASIEEAGRALDDLGADGVVFESNHHGVYLGDPVLVSIW